MKTNDAGYPQFDDEELSTLRKAQVILYAVRETPGAQYVACSRCDVAMLQIEHAITAVKNQQPLSSEVTR